MKTTYNLLFVLCTLLVVGDVSGQMTNDVTLSATIGVPASACSLGVGTGAGTSKTSWGTLSKPPSSVTGNGTAEINLQKDNSGAATWVVGDIETGNGTVATAAPSVAHFRVDAEFTNGVEVTFAPPTNGDNIASTASSTKLGYSLAYARSDNQDNSYGNDETSTTTTIASHLDGNTKVAKWIRVGGTLSISPDLDFSSTTKTFDETMRVTIVCTI